MNAPCGDKVIENQLTGLNFCKDTKKKRRDGPGSNYTSARGRYWRISVRSGEKGGGGGGVLSFKF